MKIWRNFMASKIKVTVSLEGSLVRDLTIAGHKTHKSRSRLVEEALQLWRRSLLREELKEGYLAMAEEDRAAAERHLSAGREAMG
jgi:metal-responsive CopG/Arc/MetJ family transcriptional regulator